MTSILLLFFIYQLFSFFLWDPCDYRYVALAFDNFPTFIFSFLTLDYVYLIIISNSSIVTLFYFSSCKHLLFFLLLQVFLLLTHVINCNLYFLFCSFASIFYQLLFHSYYQFNFKKNKTIMFLFKVFLIIVCQISI
jgi:hypothetical protein